jgi:acyl-homoserine lactone acylase PvdQ
MRYHDVTAALAFSLVMVLAPPARAAEPARIETPVAGQVAIYRDNWGVPHIYASTEPDGYFGLGYAQAEDQLAALLELFNGVLGWQTGSPTLTSYGLPGEFGVEALRWQHAEAGREGFARLSSALKKNYGAWIRGITRFMEEHPDKVPAGTPQLEDWLPVGVSRALLWDYMTFDGIGDCARGGVKLAHSPGESGRAPDRLASNEWVLAPWRTADHATIVLSDPHGEVDGRIFYEFRMHAGAMHVAGYTLGALFLLTHNRDLGWGQTTGAPDVSDCYELEVDPRNPARFRFDGGWRPITAREVTVKGEGGASVVRRFEHVILNDVVSPIVARVADKAYAVSTPYQNAAGLFDEEVYRWNLARSVEELRAATRLLGSYQQNMMVGDRHGRLFYLRMGRTPVRPANYDWTRPVPASTSATQWRGIHPVADLVQIVDPPQGYMQNANIPPDRMVDGEPLVRSGGYPTYIYNDVEYFRYLARGLRANEVLSRAYGFTIEDAIGLALDEKWFGHEMWRDMLQAALEANSAAVRARSDEFRRVAQRLVNFDGVAAADSVAALNHVYWRTALLKRLGAEEKASLDRTLTGREALTPIVATAMVEAVDDAIEQMRALHGSVDLQYGAVFRIRRDATRASLPLGGGFPMHIEPYSACRDLESPAFACVLTQRAFSFGQPDGEGRRYVQAGSRALRLVAFTDPIRSFSLHLYGQSDDPASAHYDDQIALASGRRLKPTYFNPDELAGHLESARVLATRADRKH